MVPPLGGAASNLKKVRTTEQVEANRPRRFSKADMSHGHSYGANATPVGFMSAEVVHAVGAQGVRVRSVEEGCDAAHSLAARAVQVQRQTH